VSEGRKGSDAVGCGMVDRQEQDKSVDKLDFPSFRASVIVRIAVKR